MKTLINTPTPITNRVNWQCLSCKAVTHWFDSYNQGQNQVDQGNDTYRDDSIYTLRPQDEFIWPSLSWGKCSQCAETYSVFDVQIANAPMSDSVEPYFLGAVALDTLPKQFFDYELMVEGYVATRCILKTQHNPICLINTFYVADHPEKKDEQFLLALWPHLYQLHLDVLSGKSQATLPNSSRNALCM
jgi:hypothetical protein